MNKTSRKRPRKQNLYSRPRKTSTFKLPWPWIVPAAAVHHAASAFFFWGPKVKTCQRIRVKCFQSVGFRSSVDYNFSRQLFLVTTHNRFGVFFWIKRSKSADNQLKLTGPEARPCEAPQEQQIQCETKRIKTSGLRGFGWLCAPHTRTCAFLFKHPHVVGQFFQLADEKKRQWIFWNHFPWSVSASILVVRTLFVS
jgi:hypothetical protein